MDRSGHTRDDVRVAGSVFLECASRMAGLDWSDRNWRAVDLSTQHRQSERPFPAECGVLHHQRICKRDPVSDNCGRFFLALTSASWRGLASFRDTLLSDPPMFRARTPTPPTT